VLGIPLTTHIYRTCINQVLIDTAYVLGLWPRPRPVPNNCINHLHLRIPGWHLAICLTEATVKLIGWFPKVYNESSRGKAFRIRPECVEERKITMHMRDSQCNGQCATPERPP
jgi:hypothetical protein